MREPLYEFNSIHPQARFRDAWSSCGSKAEQMGRALEAIAAGADIDAPLWTDGGNELMSACACGYTKVVESLCEMGADVHARKDDGATALWCAGMGHQQHYEAIEALIRHGADPETCGPRGASLPEALRRVASEGFDSWGTVPRRLAAIERASMGRASAPARSKGRSQRM